MKGVKEVKSAKITRFARAAALALFTSLTLFTSWPSAQQAPPVFRGGIELRQLDVTVRDKQRRPVRGLTAADFTILEDKTPQKIEGFSFVDLPDTVVEGPPWARTTAVDVTSNEVDSSRSFVIVIDDVGGAGDLWAEREMKKSAATFIDRLGPSDLAAVVFPAQSPASQNFTRDHAKLVKAVLDYAVTPAGTNNPSDCGVPRRLPTTLLYVIENMAGIKGQRKVIAYFGARLRIPMMPGPDPCGLYFLWRDVLQTAQQQHVSVYPIDTMGLRLKGGAAVDSYLTLANETGGRALINNNSFEEGIARIFAENSSYYLLAYQPTNMAADGRFRRVTVKVNRPGVEVTATRSYWADKPESSRRSAPPPEFEALAGVLPMSELPLRAVAVPFAIPGTQTSVAAIAVGVSQAGFGQRTTEQIDLLLRAFTSDGNDRGTDQQTIPLTVPAVRTQGEESRYEVLTRIDLPKPGSYEVRLSLHSAATGKRGSVYVDVDVPDFQQSRLSLSGVVLNNALPPGPVAPARILRDVIPVAPTTDRIFSKSDVVTAFLRAYQGVGDKLAPVNLKVTIQDAVGKAVFAKSETMAPDGFTADRSSDYQFRLPLSTLTVGDYLLSFEASLGRTVAKRDVRFSVR